MRITFLVRNIWGLGGTVKTTLNTAEALADRGHDVTIVSCVRPRSVPYCAIDERIEVVSLWDSRERADGGEHLSLLDKRRRRRPSVMGELRVKQMAESSQLLDRRVEAYLRQADTDVLVGTHITLNLYIERHCRDGIATVAQEHRYLDAYKPEVRELIRSAYRRFDAITTVTEADAAAYRKAMPDYEGMVEGIPNSIPPINGGKAPLSDPVIMAAGRLTYMKGFDTLIRAFARITDEFPEWNLRIYGRGADRKKLQQLIDDHDLGDHAQLMGPVSPLDAEWAKASICAVPSRFESFGLVIVEAMAAGVPVVCAAVEQGPLELVQSEENGLLVEPGSPKALAVALRRLMGDAGLRRTLAEGGRRTAQRFEPERVIGLHERLFERARERRSAPR